MEQVYSGRSRKVRKEITKEESLVNKQTIYIVPKSTNE